MIPVRFENEYPEAAAALVSMYRSGCYYFRYSRIAKRWGYFELPESVMIHGN